MSVIYFCMLIPVFLDPLTVSISVRYTIPPGFTRTSNTEYRAASGPAVFTCTAAGGNESENVSYQWSSTCRDCPFQSSVNFEIFRAAVHSGDTGTHTCTAARGAENASASIELNVVGKWLLLHVRGSLISSG